MTTQSLTFLLNGNRKEIPLSLVPMVDEPMHALLGELLKESPPPPSVKLLSERVKELPEKEALLLSANKNVVANKFLGLFPTSLLAILVATTAFGFLIQPAIGVLLLVLTLAYLILCHTITAWLGRKDKKQEFDRPLAMYPLSVFASPFILSHLLFNRVPSLEAKVDKTQVEALTNAPEALRYWSKNGWPLSRRLQTLESRLDQSIVAVKNLPVRSPQGEKDLADYKELLARTRAEIEKGIQLAKV